MDEVSIRGYLIPAKNILAELKIGDRHYYYVKDGIFNNGSKCVARMEKNRKDKDCAVLTTIEESITNTKSVFAKKRTILENFINSPENKAIGSAEFFTPNTNSVCYWKPINDIVDRLWHICKKYAVKISRNELGKYKAANLCDLCELMLGGKLKNRQYILEHLKS